MLIGIDASRATASQRTGTENYSLFLIRALIARGEQHRFRLYMNQLPQTELFPRDDQVEWRHISFPRLWTHLRLSWEMVRYPPDLLFVPSHVLPWIHPRCCVATVHDLGYIHYPEAHTRRARWYLDWSTRFNARASKRIIVDSLATRDDLVAFYHTDPDKMILAYPAGIEGMAPVTDQALLEGVQAKYGIGCRYLLHLGTIQPRKNLVTLVRAFELLAQTGRIADDVQLVLAGRRGWLAQPLLDEIATSPVRQRIVLPGYVDERDAAALLSGALTYILPSWYEGFGLPMLEAMACDVPVVCSNVSSLPEVAGEAAIQFNPHDMQGLATAIARIYSDDGLRQKLIQRGRENVRRFSWDQCAQNVLEAIEDAVADA